MGHFTRPLLSSLFALFAVFFSSPSFGAKSLGNPKAPVGGTFVLGYPSYPKELLFYLGFDEPSEGVKDLVHETLIDHDPKTYEFIPLLAKEWTISADKTLYTFKMDPKAKFSDGKPVTAADVKFTWDTIMNPKNKTAPIQSSYASFESCTMIDPMTVQFKAKIVHFRNLEKLGDFIVLPQHFFSQGDFNKAFKTKLLGSGPYLLENVQPGERLTFKRDPNYWGSALPQNVGANNFEKVVFRVVPDYNVQFEIFKKGEIDYFYFLISKMWATETNGTPFKNNYIKKLKAETLRPISTQGIVWNMRRPLFQDKKVRWALSHLMNRERWIKELFYNNYTLTAGTVALNSEYHSPKNKPVLYDPKKAQELLKEAGWTKLGSDGVLVKDNLRFEFTVLNDNKAAERHLTLYQEDLKKVGIKMNIRTVDWATNIRLHDDRDFDATEMARSRDVDPGDFNVTWGSKEADIKGSANTPGYKNPELDKLAKEIDETFDKKKRVLLVRKIDEMLGEDQPMAFSWESNSFRIAYWNKFGFPGKGFFPYSTWKSAWRYWWIDPAKVKLLEAAQKAGTALKD